MASWPGPMRMTGSLRRGLLAALCILLTAFGPAAAATAAPALPPVMLLIPSPAPGIAMHATLFRPPGRGPFPLAIINHGSAEDEFARATMPMPSFPGLTAWFVAHGYAVLVPLRPGHGATGGPYLEGQGPCDHADYAGAGSATADSIMATVAWMAKQPFVRSRGMIVVGNSAGGWGALALATRNPPEVAAIVAFAPGRGGHRYNRPGSNCSPDNLVTAAAVYGKTARAPTLWMSAANDTYFPPDLTRRMADAYRGAGGRLEYDLLPAVGNEGHGLILADGAATWAPYLEKFLGAVANRR